MMGPKMQGQDIRAKLIEAHTDSCSRAVPSRYVMEEESSPQIHERSSNTCTKSGCDWDQGLVYGKIRLS